MGIDRIMKYFINKNIQSIIFDNKCKISEKQLEQLADLCAYDLKKNQSQSLTGYFLLRLKAQYGRKKNNIMKVAEIEVHLTCTEEDFFT